MVKLVQSAVQAHGEKRSGGSGDQIILTLRWVDRRPLTGVGVQAAAAEQGEEIAE